MYSLLKRERETNIITVETSNPIAFVLLLSGYFEPTLFGCWIAGPLVSKVADLCPIVNVHRLFVLVVDQVIRFAGTRMYVSKRNWDSFLPSHSPLLPSFSSFSLLLLPPTVHPILKARRH